MLDDVQAVADFYSSRRGQVAAALLRRPLLEIWPDLTGRDLLGLGHTAPYLPLWRYQTRVCVEAAAAARPGPTPIDCMVQDDALPFSDQGFDRVLIAHALETASHAGRFLHAVWRVLRPEGRVLLLVPNRSGLWARGETNPFAEGAPYSTGRIERMLSRCRFRVERVRGALFAPPLDMAPLLRIGPALETAGRFVSPRLAGVLVVEAVKDVYAPIPAAAARRRPARAVLLPAGSVPAGRTVG